MSDIVVCQTPLLNTREYIESVSESFHVKAKSAKDENGYHRTHVSSVKNQLFGDVFTQRWRLAPPQLPKNDPFIYHPHETFPCPNGVMEINNESDSEKYCHHQLILPLLRILYNIYKDLEFFVTTEVRLDTICYQDNKDGKANVKAISRVDVLVRARKIGDNDTQTILVLEHKTPGTLRKSDWVSGLGGGNSELYDNAIDCARQARKYNCATMLNMVAIFDSTALVGTTLLMEDFKLWNTLSRVCMKIYWEDKKEKFLTSLLAMAQRGLIARNLVPKS
jgi:hypothetical protein